MIDVSNGSLALGADRTIGGDTLLGDFATGLASANDIDKGELNGFHVYFTDLVLWGRNFGGSLRFKNERLRLIDLVWRDGAVNRLGYDASVDDLLREKRQLTTMLASAWGRQPTDATTGVDYFQFSWGLVMVRADQRSTLCSMTIDYGSGKEA
ncbi:hypothetical protein [Massilia genomosp. 1]|uniref:Uncharacterized protein n=1 Tax=Massilia genomosp. 1 TaxID=2609280 RepID=A0ABX0MSN2_9BURK|nr:hypothetical protein [Massilia genomosp. 1]NHZ65745.1 hypothetical protein [Massilia genomosp. 1]